MGIQAWLTLAVIVVLFAVLIVDRLPTWAVFAAALTAILTLGLAPEGAALSGFANSGVLSVVVLFVVAEGMYRTGAISLLIDRAVGMPGSERAANLRILPITAAGSAFLNNTPIVAMLIPVIADLGRSARLAVSRIYMFVSHASILGGAATLIGTSTNLIIAGLVASTYGKELSVLFPTSVGLPAAVVGLAFLLLIGERLLPAGTGTDDAGPTRTRYRAELVVSERSPLAGRTLLRAGLAEPAGARLMALVRSGAPMDAPGPDVVLAAGDVLVYEASVTAVGALWAMNGLGAMNPVESPGDPFARRLGEGVVAAESRVVGQRVGDLDLKGARVVAVSRGGTAIATPIADTVVAAGDVAVVEAEDEAISSGGEAFALVRRVHGYRLQRTDRAWAASLIVGAMILVAAVGWMSLLNAALLASAALIATGCISFRAAFRAIDWQTYVVLACAVGLEPAMSGSGLADVLANGLAHLAGGSVPLAIAVVFLGAVVLTNLVTNSAAAVLMFPVASGLVTSLGAPWEPFVVVLMLGCSYAFINPAGYQTHLMVMKPGGYRFGDFAKVGIPLTVLLGLVAVPLAYLLYR